MIDIHQGYDFFTHHNTVIWQDSYRFWIWGDDGKAHDIDRCWALAGMWKYLINKGDYVKKNNTGNQTII